jgi:DNA-binding NarL/FixJ family response regulator
MTRVFLADARSDERKDLHVLLQDLKMNVVGESSDWPTTLAMAPMTGLDMLLVDWSMLPSDTGEQSLAQLRQACPHALVILLLGHLDARHQDAFSANIDAITSLEQPPEFMTERLRAAAESIRS